MITQEDVKGVTITKSIIVCINNIMWTTTWSLIIPENTVKMTTCHKIIDYLKLLFITGNIDGIKI